MNDSEKAQDQGKSRDFSAIPSNACSFSVAEFELGDNGDGAKTAPVRLIARSGKPIEHWFWGRVVHDLAGMRMHKSRIPIDYAHDSKEVIGYLNKFETESGDLVTSGALVPFKDTDRATEVVHKSRNGVPYEASINFGGDGIKVQEIGANEMAEVNGYSFDGPGVIIREWPLRGVAICPYGADMNTESMALSGVKSYTATVLTVPKTEESSMSDADTVDVAADVENTEAVEQTTDETQPVEELQAEESGDSVDADAPEGETVEADVAETNEPEPQSELSRAEFIAIVDEFGADVAAQTVKDGGNYITALKLSHSNALARIAELEARCTELSATKCGQPVPVADAEKKKKALFNTGK